MALTVLYWELISYIQCLKHCDGWFKHNDRQNWITRCQWCQNYPQSLFSALITVLFLALPCCFLERQGSFEFSWDLIAEIKVMIIIATVSIYGKPEDSCCVEVCEVCEMGMWNSSSKESIYIKLTFKCICRNLKATQHDKVIQNVFLIFLHTDCFLLLQVLNVSLEDGVEVFLEDLGGSVPSVLANSSVLSRGLVLRSSSNQISVRFITKQPAWPGLLLLHYKGTVWYL